MNKLNINLTQSRYLNVPAILFLIFTLLVGASTNAQEKNDDFFRIKKNLLQQQQDWNNGDIDAFMTAYWKSEDLQFGGASGITKGWQQTLEGYKKRYPDKAAMGKLTFQVKDISRHSKKVISLTGSWDLKRTKDELGGHFLLIWKKIKGEWLIVVDHTSSK